MQNQYYIMAIKLNKYYIITFFIISILLLFYAIIESDGVVITYKYPFVERRFYNIDFKMFGAILGAYAFIFSHIKFVLSNYKRIIGLNVKAKKTQSYNLLSVDLQIINGNNQGVTLTSFKLHGFIPENEIEDRYIDTEGKDIFNLKFIRDSVEIPRKLGR